MINVNTEIWYLHFNREPFYTERKDWIFIDIIDSDWKFKVKNEEYGKACKRARAKFAYDKRASFGEIHLTVDYVSEGL